MALGVVKLACAAEPLELLCADLEVAGKLGTFESLSRWTSSNLEVKTLKLFFKKIIKIIIIIIIIIITVQQLFINFNSFC